MNKPRRAVCPPSPIEPPLWLDDDDEDYKDVYDPTGPALQFLQMQKAFATAGYVIRKTEVSSHEPPLIILRLIRRTAPLFSSGIHFHRHIRQILESAGVPKDDVVIEQSGNRSLVSFFWQTPVPVSIEALGLDELLAQLP